MSSNQTYRFSITLPATGIAESFEGLGKAVRACHLAMFKYYKTLKFLKTKGIMHENKPRKTNTAVFRNRKWFVK